MWRGCLWSPWGAIPRTWHRCTWLVFFFTFYIHKFWPVWTVNNVGKSHTMPAYLVDTPKDEITDIVSINVNATLRVTYAVLPGMIQRCVINSVGLLLTPNIWIQKTWTYPQYRIFRRGDSFSYAGHLLGNQGFPCNVHECTGWRSWTTRHYCWTYQHILCGMYTFATIQSHSNFVIRYQNCQRSARLQRWFPNLAHTFVQCCQKLDSLVVQPSVADPILRHPTGLMHFLTMRWQW